MREPQLLSLASGGHLLPHPDRIFCRVSAAWAHSSVSAPAGSSLLGGPLHPRAAAPGEGWERPRASSQLAHVGLPCSCSLRTEEWLISQWGSIFTKRERLLGSKEGGCAQAFGWAVAAGQGCMGWGPGRWECQGLRCAPLAAMQGECLPRVEDGGGSLVPAELWTLALPSASPGSCGNLGHVAGGSSVSVLLRALGLEVALWPSDPHPALREARNWGMWPSPHPLSLAAHPLGSPACPSCLL